MSKDKKKKSSIVTSLVIGGAIGSVLGVLFAPKKGEDLRKDIKKKATNIKDSSVEVRDKIQEVVEIAQEKSKDVTTKVRDNINKAPKGVMEKLIEWLEEEDE